jgi:tRNA 2-thiouridine synthesizing protein A
MAAVARITLDCRRLLCPLPVIRVQDRVAQLNPGARLEVLCTDPGALKDIPAWCRMNGHDVLGTISDGSEHVIVLRVVAGGH